MDVGLSRPFNRDERYKVAIATFRRDPVGLLALYHTSDATWRAWADAVLWETLLTQEMGASVEMAAASGNKHGMRHLYMAHLIADQLKRDYDTRAAAKQPMGNVQVLFITVKGMVYEVFLAPEYESFTASLSHEKDFNSSRLIQAVESAMEVFSSFPIARSRRGTYATAKLRYVARWDDATATKNRIMTLVFTLLGLGFRWDYQEVDGQRQMSLYSCISCDTARVTRVCGDCEIAGYCSEKCADAHWHQGGHAHSCKGTAH